MTTIADLKAQLEAAEAAELAALELPSLAERIAEHDRRLDRLTRQRRDLTEQREATAAERDERIRRGAAAGVSHARLADAAGVARSRVVQIVNGGEASPESSSRAEAVGA